MAKRKSPGTISPRPNLLWRLGVVVGVGTMTAVTVNDDAWEAFDDATGGSVERDRVRALLTGTALLHVAEAAVAWRGARRAGLERPGRWARSTLLWGFPVLRRLRRARLAAAG